MRIGPTYGCRKASLTLKRENEYYLPQRPEVSLQVYFFKEIYRHGKKMRTLGYVISRRGLGMFTQPRFHLFDHCKVLVLLKHNGRRRELTMHD